MPPPGSFVKEDLYARKRWRKTQYLLNEFWARWRKEYLLIQQTRSKWNTPSRNISVGDIVILRDDGIRGHWMLAKVIETIVDADNLVRRVKLLIGTLELTKDGRRQGELTILERPVHKITLLLECES